ncbi:MAG: hypothetical protein NVSMB5_02550 [Candidatus Velthaea sp.]
MTPLDLTLAPPRSPRLTFGGLDFLPRSIDKVRASLPGGNLGEYKVWGTTEVMLQTLGVPLETFTAAVASAQTDDDVLSALKQYASTAKFDEWNALLALRRPRGGNRDEALEVYPWLSERPDLIFIVDVLEEDDRQLFEGQKNGPDRS